MLLLLLFLFLHETSSAKQSAILRECLPAHIEGKTQLDLASTTEIHLQNDRGAQISYWNDSERKTHQVLIQDGKFISAENQATITSKNQGLFTSHYRKTQDYVFSPDQKLYIFDEANRLRHSSVLAAKPVAGAGELGLLDGRLNWISNASGHYTPSKRILRQVLEQFFSNDVDLSQTQIFLTDQKLSGLEENFSEDAEVFLFSTEPQIQCIKRNLLESDWKTVTFNELRVFSRADPGIFSMLIEKKAKLRDRDFLEKMNDFFNQCEGCLEERLIPVNLKNQLKLERFLHNCKTLLHFLN